MNNSFTQQQTPKYKFIPPTKLQKPKTPQHSISFIESHSVNLDDAIKDQVSPQKNKQKNNTNISKSNQENSSSEFMKIGKSISNPKLKKSNSRNAGLTHKTQPCEGYKNQLYLDRLNLIIKEMEDKDMHKNCELAALRQENKNLAFKLEKNLILLGQRNKQIAELNDRIQHLQGQIIGKNQEHSLIIDSLKKIIENKISKINQQKQKITKLEKNKTAQPQKIESIHNILSTPYIENNNQLKSEQKCRNYVLSLKKSVFASQDGQPEEFRSKQHSRHCMDEHTALELTGTGEQDGCWVSTPEVQVCQLALSRISESLEQDLQSSRQKQPQLQNNNNNKQSTHQQLLDQIDLFLSKRHFHPQKGKKIN